VPFYKNKNKNKNIKMSLVIIGKDQVDQIREDIKLGNITPAIGTERAYTDTNNPNVNFHGTTWQRDTTYNFQYSDEITEQTITLVKWVRTV
jgi:hypothetical protein